jgi:hypothetical protein
MVSGSVFTNYLSPSCNRKFFMSDSKKASASVTSGSTHKDFQSKLGGFPGKKSVEEIEKVNTPGKAPGSVRS